MKRWIRLSLLLCGCSSTQASLEVERMDDASVMDQTDVIRDASPERILVRCSGLESSQIRLGSRHVLLSQISIRTPEQRAVLFRGLSGYLVAISGTGRRFSSSADEPFFFNFSLRDREEGATMMGPVELESAPNASEARFSFTEPTFSLLSGAERQLSLTVDVAGMEQDVTGFVSSVYRFHWEGERTIFGQRDLQWVDTTEFVRGDEIEYAESCFSTEQLWTFQVIP